MLRPLLQRLGFAVSLLTAPALLLTHCDNTSTTSATQHVAGIELATTTGPITGIGLGIKVGGVLQLFAQGRDATGAPIPGATIAWASSAPSVATVTQQGLVTGVTPGTTTVTASSGTVTASLALTVLDTSVPPPPTGTTLFADDFTSGASYQWTGLVGSWSTVSDGSNVWRQSNLSGDYWGVVGSTAWKDYSIQARVKVLAWNNGTGIARIFARWQNTTNWIYLNAAQNGTLQLRKYVNGTITDLAPPKAMGFVPGTWYTLKLAVQGTAITASVNGVVQLTATDATFAAGPAAVGGWNSTAEFDDVLVTDLSGTTPPPPPVTVVGSVSVAPATAGLSIGATQQLTATVKDTAGTTLSGQAVAWTSLHPSWATVSSSGLVTGVAAGVDTVTATSSGKTGRSIVTVSVIAPPPPTSGSVVLIGAGDITGSTTEGEPTAKLLDAAVAAGGNVTVFTAGDQAYQNGSSSDYANYYNPTWGRQKARTKPSPGNHDYNTSGASGYFGYFGSVAGPGYYSYNIGAWHVISLNSNVSQSTSSSQGTWLANDLKNATQRCIVAYWHHPRFSSGSNHGSDTGMDPFWRALYAAGATLVLNGHDHDYERFAPQNPSAGSDPTKGIREFVVGTGGASFYGFGSALANSEVRNSSTHGVLKLTLSDSTYAWEFIPVAGSSFRDTGTGKCVARGTVTPVPGIGMVDPTLLPVATLAQAPLVSAFNALGVPGLAAGATYRDPTTGVTVTKITSASFPTSASSWHHDYSEGGYEISLPYKGSTRAVLVNGSGYYLVDFLPGSGVSNGRPLPSNLRPCHDQAFSFSSNPATPWYAYVSTCSTVVRFDIRTMTEAPGNGWPVTGETEAVWLQQTEGDSFFTWMRGQSGPTVVGYEPATGTRKTMSVSNVDQPQINRNGSARQVAINTTPQEGLILWDFASNSTRCTAPGDPNAQFNHLAALRDRWMGMDWNNGHYYDQFLTDCSVQNLGLPGSSADFYAAGQWSQPTAGLDNQWALFSTQAGLVPSGSGWLAPGGMIFVNASGGRRLLGHPYNGSLNYLTYSFAQPSSDGRVVLFTSDMNGSGRSDLFLAEVPSR